MNKRQSDELRILIDKLKEASDALAHQAFYYISSQDTQVQGLNEAGQNLEYEKFKSLKNDYVNAKLAVDNLLKEIEL